VNLVRTHCNQRDNDKFRVFTFGVGNDCDKSLVKEIAEAGHGSHYFAADTNLSVLKTKVIDALAKAQEPALSNCTFDFGVKSADTSALIDPAKKFFENQLFRNQITRYFTVMTEKQFNDGFTCTFDCEFDPKTKAGVNHQFESNRFEQVQFVDENDKEFLFKMACKNEIDELKE